MHVNKQMAGESCTKISQSNTKECYTLVRLLGAYLGGAYLGGAYLGGAYLGGRFGC